MKKLLLISLLIFNISILAQNDVDFDSDTIAKNTSELYMEKFSQLDKQIKRDIAIYNSEAVGNYGFTDATFSIINFSKKTIKYITFNYWGENRVEDKVVSKSGKFMISSKGIGPIEYFKDADIKFANVWATDIVYYLILDSVDIIYMDGSKKHISILASDYISPNVFNELEDLRTKIDYEESNREK